MSWIAIPAGPFLMGAQRRDPATSNHDPGVRRNEVPVHEVDVDAYEIGRYPVTVSEFQQFVHGGGYHNPDVWAAGGFGETARPDRWDWQIPHPEWPVTGVGWNEAAAFCAWARCRLPTEAEWERAARGTRARKYPWGDDQPDSTRANFGGTVGHPTPVGLYRDGATAEGIHNLAGNVWEWVADWYGEKYYRVSPRKNPGGPETGVTRVARGGSFADGANCVRAACRLKYVHGLGYSHFGFRCARGVVP